LLQLSSPPSVSAGRAHKDAVLLGAIAVGTCSPAFCTSTQLTHHTDSSTAGSHDRPQHRRVGPGTVDPDRGTGEFFAD
jgi:hypothetical protein